VVGKKSIKPEEVKLYKNCKTEKLLFGRRWDKLTSLTRIIDVFCPGKDNAKNL
jgi:hypothetical protein